MSAVALEHQIYTIKEYLEINNNALERYEYHDGFIRAMSGGTINHGVLCNNAGTILNNGIQAKKSNCISFGSEVKVQIEKSNSFIYPDAMLVCGGVQTSEHDPNAVVNPLLVVEVLSKSTERYDRGDKFHKYCYLTSFKEYVLIDQYKPVVDILYKADASYWKMTTAIGLEQSFYLHTIDLEVQMATLYRGVQPLAPPIFKMELD